MLNEQLARTWTAHSSGQSVARWERAQTVGAAAQRNQGIRLTTQRFVWFVDDDILFESDCVEQLWRAISADAKLGGANAMIVNQRYHSPGIASRTLFILMHGGNERSFAGKVIGPAINLLPEDRADLPDVVPVQWLNTTCTMYRREALPSPPFDPFFTGYSLMEDVALSLNVAKQGWKLANVRIARIFHNSQPGEHKEDVGVLSEMELVNRHYVMTRILGRTSIGDYAKLAFFEAFGLSSSLLSGRGFGSFRAAIAGKARAAARLRSSRTDAS
jgi:GT2 family glycosyltransferase